MGIHIITEYKQKLNLILDDFEFKDRTFKRISQIHYKLCDAIQSLFSHPSIAAL